MIKAVVVREVMEGAAGVKTTWTLTTAPQGRVEGVREGRSSGYIGHEAVMQREGSRESVKREEVVIGREVGC